MKNRAYYQEQYRKMRMDLLAIVIFSAVNLFSIIFTETYFLFSSYVTQLLAAVGYSMFVETGSNLYIVVSILFGLVSIVPYLLCFIFSKKNSGWMIGAGVLFGIDTLLLLVDAFSSGMFPAFLMDIVFHALALAGIIWGIIAARRRDALPEEEEIAPAVLSGVYAAPADVPTRTLTVIRAKGFYASLVSFTVFVDGQAAGMLKNGATLALQLDEGPHTLSVGHANGSPLTTVNVPEGAAPHTYTVRLSMGMTDANISITEN